MSRRVRSPNAEVMAVTAAENCSSSRRRPGEGSSTPGILPIAVVEIPRARPREAALLTEASIIEALRPVQDPELHMSIVDLEMIRGVRIDGGRVAVTVALTVAGCPLRAEITKRVTDAVSALDGVSAVEVDLTVMTPEELDALRGRLGGG